MAILKTKEERDAVEITEVVPFAFSCTCGRKIRLRHNRGYFERYKEYISGTLQVQCPCGNWIDAEMDFFD